MKARITVPSHGPPTVEGQALLEANRRNLEGTRRAVMNALGSASLAEEVAAFRLEEGRLLWERH